MRGVVDREEARETDLAWAAPGDGRGCAGKRYVWSTYEELSLPSDIRLTRRTSLESQSRLSCTVYHQPSLSDHIDHFQT